MRNSPLSQTPCARRQTHIAPLYPRHCRVFPLFCYDLHCQIDFEVIAMSLAQGKGSNCRCRLFVRRFVKREQQGPVNFWQNFVLSYIYFLVLVMVEKHYYTLQSEEGKRSSLLALPSKTEHWTFLRVPGMTMPIGDADLDTRGCLCYWEKSAKCGCRPVVVCIPPLNQAHVKALIRILSFGIWFSATSCFWFLNCQEFLFANKANITDKIGDILSAKNQLETIRLGNTCVDIIAQTLAY